MMVYAHFSVNHTKPLLKIKEVYELQSREILQKTPEPGNIRCNGTNNYQVTEAHMTHYPCRGILGENTKKIIT